MFSRNGLAPVDSNEKFKMNSDNIVSGIPYMPYVPRLN
jgi:hypothetical protein